jgi:hypothetical protein
MSHISLKNIDYSLLSVVKNGKSLKIYYKDSPLQIVTETLYTPFGVKSFSNNYSNISNYHLDCSVDNHKSVESQETISLFNNLDTKIMNLINENLDLFHVKNMTDCDYSKFLKDPKGDYPGLLKIQLPRDSKGNFETVVFNHDKEKMPIDESNIQSVFTKGTTFKSIIECSRLWHFNGKFGASFMFKQIKLVPKEPVENLERVVDTNLFDSDTDS